jgi:hypothetical protein
MTLTINDIDYEIPFDPQWIKLDDYIEFQNQYGKKLDEDLQKIFENDKLDPYEQEIALEDHIDNEAIAWFSFWSKVDLTVAKNTPSIEPALYHYRILRSIFLDSEKEAEEKFMEPFVFEEETWYLQDWKVNPANTMTFNEIITSKEIIRQARKFSMGKWASMKYLCAVFLRKKNEPFSDELIWEGSERLILMGSMPVAYAMRVGFFLLSCVSILKKCLASSAETEPMSLMN